MEPYLVIKFFIGSEKVDVKIDLFIKFIFIDIRNKKIINIKADKNFIDFNKTLTKGS